MAELCRGYVAELPRLQERILQRRRREEEELGLPNEPRLRRGVWTFDPVPQSERDVADSIEVRRRRALALPDYYEVAHLLVRRRLVTVADLARLASRDGSDHGTTTAR